MHTLSRSVANVCAILVVLVGCRAAPEASRGAGVESRVSSPRSAVPAPAIVRTISPRPLPIEPDRLPEDLRIEVGWGLRLQLALDAQGRLSFVYGAPPSVSPLTSTPQREVAYLTWSGSIPRTRVQAMWSAIRRGAHRAGRTILRAPVSASGPPKTAGVRIVAYGALSELWPSALAGSAGSASPEYFQVIDAVRDALDGRSPSVVDLDRALSTVRNALRRCLRTGGAAHLWLELDAQSGQMREMRVLSPESGAPRSCVERAASAVRFPPLRGEGAVRVQLRTHAQDAWLEVLTDAPADLQVDDASVGRTNQGLALLPGPHRVVVIASGAQHRHDSRHTLLPDDHLRLDLRTRIEPPPVPADLEIGIVRTSRDGREPAYSIRVDAAGKVHYVGYRNVRQLGPTDGQVAADRALALWQAYLELAAAPRPNRSFVAPLLSDGPTLRIVVRAQAHVARLDLEQDVSEVHQALGVAALAEQIDRMLESERWTGTAARTARCAWDAAEAELTAQLEALVRARCLGTGVEPMRLEIGVLGATGTLGRLSSWASEPMAACLAHNVPLLEFPLCDVPFYVASISLFGPKSVLASRVSTKSSGQLALASHELPRPGLGDPIATPSGPLTLLHIELAGRLGHRASTLAASPGHVFVLAHVRFANSDKSAAFPRLELDDAWGARWPSDPAATALLAPLSRAQLSTVVFEVPAAGLLAARNVGWGMHQQPHASVMELHGDVRLVVSPDSGREGVSLLSTRVAVSSPLQQRWTQEAGWIERSLEHMEHDTKAEGRNLLPVQGQWLRVDHALSRDSDTVQSRTLRREPSRFSGVDAKAALQLGFLRSDGQWLLSDQRRVDPDYAETGAWSHACAREEQDIVGSLQTSAASANESCALHGFVTAWSCLRAFEPGSVEEALRLRMEAHRKRCGPRDPLLREPQ